MDKHTVSHDGLIARYVEENPAKPGPADARLIGYGVPVWVLVGYLPAVGHRAREVAADYDLPAAPARRKGMRSFMPVSRPA